MKIIPNGVDFDVFKQIDRNYCKEILNLSKKKICTIFANKKNPRKIFRSSKRYGFNK